MHADAGEVIRVWRIFAVVKALGRVVEGVLHELAERQGAVGVGLSLEALG